MKTERVSQAEARAMLAKKRRIRRSKFNVRTDAEGRAARSVGGILFDSQGEAARWFELTRLERVGQITNLERQRRVMLVPKADKIRAIALVVDFTYHENGHFIFEDFKGVSTPVFRLKLNLMRRRLLTGEIMRVTHADGTQEEWAK